MPPEYWEHLVGFGGIMKDTDPVLGEYATLQRINLVHLQNELAEIKADLVQHQTTSETHMLQLKSTMHDYGNYPIQNPCQSMSYVLS